MRHERQWAKACALLGALGAIAVLPATVVATGSNTGPHSSDIEVSKTAIKAVTAGETTTITWKVIVANDGGRDLEQVTLHDPGVDFGPPVSSFDTHCTDKRPKDDKSTNEHHNASPCADDMTLLQEHETLTYTGTQVMAKACGWIKNTVVVTAEDMISGRIYGRQKPTLEASATAKIFLECADFEVLKRAKESTYNRGETITWIVTVKNTGNVALSNPVLTDPGVTFGSPSSNHPANTYTSAKSARTAKGVTSNPPSCETRRSSKSRPSTKPECEDDDPKCKDIRYSSKSSAPREKCTKDDGVLKPGETLTFLGTQTADTCGVVSNTVTVTVTSRPGKGHGDDKAKGDDTYASSKAMAGPRKKAVGTTKKYTPKPGEKPKDKPKDRPHTPPMPAVEITKTSAPATTFVLCDVVVTKTAAVQFTRTFDWSIVKTVDSPTFNVAPGASATASYTVTATKSAAKDTGFTVSGSITVKNPYPTALPVTVTDHLTPAQGRACVVTNPVASIDAGGTASFTYSCALGDTAPPAGTTNTATASFTVNGQPMTASGMAAVTVGNPTAVVNDSVSVTDTLNDVGGALFGPVSTTTTKTYTRMLAAPATAPNCIDYTNVATVILDANVTKATAPVVVRVCAVSGTTPLPPVGIVGTPVQPPSLRVTKAGPATATAGRLVTYRITVSNRGAGEALAVMLRDVLPRGFSVPGKVAGGSVDKGAVRWDLGTLAAGESRTVKVTFRLDRGIKGRRCNTAIATPSNGASASGTRCTRIARVAGVARDPRVTG